MPFLKEYLTCFWHKLPLQSLDFSVTQETRWAPHWADSKLKPDLLLGKNLSWHLCQHFQVLCGKSCDRVCTRSQAPLSSQLLGRETSAWHWAGSRRCTTLDCRSSQSILHLPERGRGREMPIDLNPRKNSGKLNLHRRPEYSLLPN